MGKRELIALLNLSSCCLVMVERLFLALPRGCLQFVVVVFPDHTHLLFLPYSVSCYLNVSFIHSTILDCLLAFQVIKEKETLIINKLFCFKIICHNVHAQIYGTFCIYKM